MDIVANNFMLRRFKTIDIFKLNLGFNLKGPVSMKPGEERPIRIKDEFIKKYQTITGRIINSYGSIGTLKFYEDTSVPSNEWHIYKEGNVFEVIATNEDLKKEIRDYLSETLKNIEEITKNNFTSSEEEIIPAGIKKDVIYTSVPEEIDRPDMTLPKDQYIDLLVKRRKMKDSINNG